jgi:phosphatidylglycerophosphate synthase
MTDSAARLVNVPNTLTTLRLALVPVFLFALFAGDGHETRWRIAAFVIFAVAVVTDRFDGALARSYGLETEFGKLADPIADKALIGAALIGLSLLRDLPWWVTVVILVREIGVTVLRFAVLRRGVIPASRDRHRAVHPAVAWGVAHGRGCDHGDCDRADGPHRRRLRGGGRQRHPQTIRWSVTGTIRPAADVPRG